MHIKLLIRCQKKKKIIFAPDKNLGNYINSLTGRNMIIWEGACHVHEEFSIERIIELKKEIRMPKLLPILNVRNLY